MWSSLILSVAAIAVYRLVSSRASKVAASYANKSVVIIGASSGIGKFLALAYAKMGAQLFVVARREPRLQELVAECASLHSECTAQYSVVDITISSNRLRLIREIGLWLGPHKGLDVLVLNAGIMDVSPFAEIDSDVVEKVTRQIFETNTLAPIALTHLFLPFLIKNPVPSTICVLSSIAGKIPAPTRTLYCGSKFALQGFFQSLAIELEAHAVRICLVCPGRVSGTELRSSGEQSSDTDSDGLRPQTVASETIKAVHEGKNIVYLPKMYFWVELLQLFAPKTVGALAKAKYNFK